jgi:protein-disulfide isomerase
MRFSLLPLLLLPGLALADPPPPTAPPPADKPAVAPIVVVEFFDPDCELCKAMKPIVDEVMASHGPKITDFERVDITDPEGAERAEAHHVASTPTFVLSTTDGTELNRVEGQVPKETLEKLIEQGIEEVGR